MKAEQTFVQLQIDIYRCFESPTLWSCNTRAGVTCLTKNRAKKNKTLEKKLAKKKN